MKLGLITSKTDGGAEYKLLKIMTLLLDNEDILVEYCEKMFDESFDICERLGEMIHLIKSYKDLVNKERAKEGKLKL